MNTITGSEKKRINIGLVCLLLAAISGFVFSRVWLADGVAMVKSTNDIDRLANDGRNLYTKNNSSTGSIALSNSDIRLVGGQVDVMSATDKEYYLRETQNIIDMEQRRYADILSNSALALAPSEIEQLVALIAEREMTTNFVFKDYKSK